MLLNGSLQAGLAFKSLLNISVYAQTLALFVACVTLFLPFQIPFFPVISWVVTGIYIWLGIKQAKESPAPPIAPAA